MSEKIFAWLLRLYPVHFRKTYGEAAMQLVRDRFRAERGFLPRLWLWFDLLADLAISVPREYRHAPAVPAKVSAQPSSNGALAFLILETKPPAPSSLFLGGLLSLTTFVAVLTAIGHNGNSPMMRSRIKPSTLQPSSLHSSKGSEEKTVASHQDGRDASRKSGGVGISGGFGIAPPLMSKASHDAAVKDSQAKPAVGVIAVQAGNLDAAEKQRVIEAVTRNLKERYFDRDTGQRMVDSLLAHEKGGDYGSVEDGAAFADLLTRQIRDVSHDPHLVVVYSQTALRDHSMGPAPEELARYRKEMELSNCTFEKVEVLPHNIGYLKLNSFPDPSVCQSTAVSAMASLNSANAIIFDLRDNRGGYPAGVALIAAYLFDHPEYLYSPRDNTTEQSWTRSPVPGNKLADKPAYVLVSPSTFSGAEAFSYDLKMLKRATIVGETTGGGAHAAVFHRIDDHFGMGIPEVKPINPFAKADWEGTGVEPDVKVKAADALVTAEKLARGKLSRR